MKYTLTYGEDSEFGGLGFRIEGTKINTAAYNMATDGLLIAHDLLEHQNGLKEIGTIGDELEALGGIWFVRGQFGDISRNGRGSMYSAEENIASDIVNMGRNIVLSHTRYYKLVPAVNINGFEFLDSFNTIISYARKSLKNELEGEEYKQEDFNRYLDDALRFMISGYRKAKNRFRPIGGALRANTIFWNIAEAVDDALKQAEYEGQQFALHVVNSTAEAHCREINPYQFN